MEWEGGCGRFGRIRRSESVRRRHGDDFASLAGFLTLRFLHPTEVGSYSQRSSSEMELGEMRRSLRCARPQIGSVAVRFGSTEPPGSASLAM